MNARERSDGGTPSLEVHIEELVLHGFPPGAGQGLADAVKAELEHRLATGSARRAVGANAGTDIERVDAGTIHVADPGRPAAVGEQVGGAVASALTAGGRP
jgi:hypothetical protein